MLRGLAIEPRTCTKHVASSPAILHLSTACIMRLVGSGPGRILQNLKGKPKELDGTALRERECLSWHGELRVNGMSCGTSEGETQGT